MLKAGFGSITMLLGLSALARARQNYQSHWPDRLPDKEQGSRSRDRRQFSPPYLDPTVDSLTKPAEWPMLIVSSV